MAAALKTSSHYHGHQYAEARRIQATKYIKITQPTIRVIGLSIINDQHVTEAMKKAGAHIVLLKDDLNEFY